MDRIDRSVMRRPSGVIIKHWVKQDPAPPCGSAPQPEAEEAQREFDAQNTQTTPDVEALAREHAAKIIDDAQDEADALLAAAAAQAEDLRIAAQEEGFSAGQQQGQQQALLEQQALAKELNAQFSAMLKELRTRENGRDSEMERNILHLSLEIAEKILNITLENDDMVFMGLVKEAVRRLNAKDKFAIHLNQREYDRFFAEGSGWLHDAIQSAPFTVSVDAAVAPGGLMLTSQEGTVRAGVDTQLDKLKHALLSQVDDSDEQV